MIQMDLKLIYQTPLHTIALLNSDNDTTSKVTISLNRVGLKITYVNATQ